MGTEEVVSENKKVWEWLRDGGLYEDAPPGFIIPYRRSRNHFLNPLNGSGYTGFLSFCGVGHCPVNALVWAKGPQDSDLYLDFDLNPGGDWSWGAVRDRYYNALTLRDKTARGAAFADTFRGLGQLMHLVTDMSVPSHTRNDGHILYNYEDHVSSSEYSGEVPAATTNPEHYKGASVSIDSLFTTLAAYTNANFFSEDTINHSAFASPAINDTTPIVTKNITNQWLGYQLPRLYYARDAATGSLLSTVDFLHDYRVANQINLTQPNYPVLDDNVYSDYAALLLPRAVGYSADLIDHFFRGRIDMLPDPATPGSYIIKNDSAEKLDGTFTLYYDDEFDNRLAVKSWNRVIEANRPSDPVAFTEPTNPAPKEKGRYILVFNGTLGQEQGAVVGREVTLDGGVWEDWDNGIYAKISHYSAPWYLWKKYDRTTYYFYHTYELFTLDTGRHIWNGFWNTGESPDPSISVEGGALKIAATTGSWPMYEFNDYYTSYSNNNNRRLTSDVSPKIPLERCRLKMDIPVAEVGYKRYGYQGNTVFSIELSITYGAQNDYKIYYAVDDVSQLSSWEKESYLIIPTGKVEQSLEDGFNHLKKVYWWNNFGDISNWKVEQVGMHYSVAGKDNFIRVVVDYIDFVCDK